MSDLFWRSRGLCLWPHRRRITPPGANARHSNARVGCNSGMHDQLKSKCPLCAKSGHSCQQNRAVQNQDAVTRPD